MHINYIFFDANYSEDIILVLKGLFQRLIIIIFISKYVSSQSLNTKYHFQTPSGVPIQKLELLLGDLFTLLLIRGVLE